MGNLSLLTSLRSLLEFRTPAHRLFDIQEGAPPARDLRYRVSLCEQPPTQHDQSPKQQGQHDPREHPGKVVIVLRVGFGSVEISHLSQGGEFSIAYPKFMTTQRPRPSGRGVFSFDGLTRRTQSRL